MPRTRFKLTFRQIMVRGPQGLAQRALIIAVGDIPGQRGWLQAILACEDGTMTQKAITLIEFELSAKNEVTMMEADGEAARPALYAIEPAAG